MTLFSGPKKVWVALATLFFISFGVALALSLPGAQAPTYTSVNSGIADSTFIAKTGGSCPGNSGHLTSQATFSNCVNNNGSCGSSTTRMMTFNEMNSCKVTSRLQTQTLSGTATGPEACNQTCINNGGSPIAASDYVVSDAVNTNDGTHPVQWSVLRSAGDSSADSCTVKIMIGATTVLGSTVITNGATLTGTYTGGVTGTMTFTAHDASNAGTCTISGNSITYYN